MRALLLWILSLEGVVKMKRSKKVAFAALVGVAILARAASVGGQCSYVRKYVGVMGGYYTQDEQTVYCYLYEDTGDGLMCRLLWTPDPPDPPLTQGPFTRHGQTVRRQWKISDISGATCQGHCPADQAPQTASRWPATNGRRTRRP